MPFVYVLVLKSYFVHVCIDERDINTDFLLVLLRDMLNAYPQLKVILMSGMLKSLK